jgi:adenylate kinase
VVLDIVVPEDVLVRRLATRRICGNCGVNAAVEWTGDCQKCGGKLIARIDDSVEIVRERLEIFLRQTKPLVDYYSRRASFRSIDGNQPPDVVTQRIDEALIAACRSATL